MRKDVCINIRQQRYIETVMRDTSNAGMLSCTKSCYSIEYSIRVQRPKAVNVDNCNTNEKA